MENKQPEKNCGKPEPQGWEDGFVKKWGFLQNLSVGFSEMLNDIRQVAAEEREKEKDAIVAFLRGHWLMTDGLAPMAGDIKQNKHRGEK